MHWSQGGETKGRPQTLREIQKGTESCKADATMRRKTRSDARTATRDKAQLQMCRKTKAGLKDELIEEFSETLSDELNLQPMRSGEPMHIHLQDGQDPAKQLYLDKLPRDSRAPQTLP